MPDENNTPDSEYPATTSKPTTTPSAWASRRPRTASSAPDSIRRAFGPNCAVCTSSLWWVRASHGGTPADWGSCYTWPNPAGLGLTRRHTSTGIARGKPQMMLHKTMIAAGLAIAATCGVASAQALPAGRVYTFHSTPQGSCPALDWHVVVQSNGDLSGMIAWNNMQSMARATGTVNMA